MATTSDLRLAASGIRTTGRRIAMTFDGIPVAALKGETVAAALQAAGIRALRVSGSGAPRGLFCGIGACQDCLVEIDGRTGQRACMRTAADGLAIRTQRHAAWANGPGEGLAPLCPSPAGTLSEEHCDCAIVGAGPAGLAAALALREAGLSVVLADERPAPGGQYFKPLAPSHALAGGRDPDRQFREGRRLVAAVAAAGADIRAGTTVWSARAAGPGGFELGLYADGRAAIVRSRALVLATGALERPCHVEGWTLPGVMTTGAAQTLARAYRVAPGARVLVAGNGPLNLQVAAELLAGGVRVVAVAERARLSRPAAAADLLGAALASPDLIATGLRYRARLLAAHVPLFEGHALVRIEGAGRAERAILVGPRGERSFEVDAVCLGDGFAPASELSRQLGCEHAVDAAGAAVPVVDETGATSQPGLWIAGEAAGFGGARVALAEGTLAGFAAARHLGAATRHGTEQAARRGLARARGFQRRLWSLFAASAPRPGVSDATVLCRCEEVTFAAVRRAIESGACDLGSLKRLTRLGMGRCQGRFCALAAASLLAGATGRAPGPLGLFAPQTPVKPVPAAALAVEKPEWGGHREVPAPVFPLAETDGAPLPASADLLVVGAGVLGAATAMYASGHGIDTLVVDRGPPNGEASGGNAGSLHVQLLSFDHGARAQGGGGPALATLPLQREGVDLWRALEAELGGDFEIVVEGGLMVAENEAETRFLEEKSAAERSVGIPVEVIGRNALAGLAPFVAGRMVAAAFCPLEGKINPLKATPAIVAEARRRGARFESGAAVTAIEADREAYRVTTTRGPVRARRLVLAAGGWTARLGAMLGLALPVTGAPLQMIVTEPAPPLARHLLAHAGRHLTLKQGANGNLIVGGGWTAAADPATGRGRVLRESLEGNLWAAARTLPALEGLHVIRSWAAMNVNIDGAPLLGALPGHPRAFVAATANGYTLGPLVGRITAGLVATGRAGRDVAGFTLERFT